MSEIKRRKTSEVWNFFTPIDTTTAVCDMCKSKLSYKTSTSNLKKHIKNRHPTVTVPNTRREFVCRSNENVSESV